MAVPHPAFLRQILGENILGPSKKALCHKGFRTTQKALIQVCLTQRERGTIRDEEVAM